MQSLPILKFTEPDAVAFPTRLAGMIFGERPKGKRPGIHWGKRFSLDANAIKNGPEPVTLVSAKLVVPLEQVQDRTWLAKVTNALNQDCQKKNAYKKGLSLSGTQNGQVTASGGGKNGRENLSIADR